MTRPLGLLGTAACALWLSGAAAGAAEGFGPYVVQAWDGWTVQVEQAFLEGPEQALAEQALRVLRRQSEQADRLLPPRLLQDLKQAPIFLNRNDGKSAMAYHPSRRWLAEHNRNPAMAGCVQVERARYFVDWVSQQPLMLIHELAHMLDHKTYDWAHPEVLRAFRAAEASGRYEQVANSRGRVVRHYALSNAKEYFAELTESWFGRNDFFPFTREDLRPFDPQGLAAVEAAWFPGGRTGLPSGTGSVQPVSSP